MKKIVLAALLMLCAAAALADDGFKPGTIGNLQFVNPKLNAWYRGENDPGRRYEIVARARILPDRPMGIFMQNGAAYADIDLTKLPAEALASLRDQCPEYILCIGRWDVELTDRRTAYGGMVVDLYGWHR